MAEDVDFELTKPVQVFSEIKDGIGAEIKDLKRILSAEQAATATYKSILKNLHDTEESNEIKNILVEHKRAIEFWKTQLRAKDIHVKNEPGPWHSAIDSLESGENLKDQGRIINALKEGEEHVFSEYEEILNHSKVNFQSTAYIRNICLDQQRKHVAILEGLNSSNQPTN